MGNITLITGATGLVGHAITSKLIERGREVRVMVRDPQAAAAFLPKDCQVVAGDVTDSDSIARALRGCNVAYHAAGVPEQWLADSRVFSRVNLGGTVNMIEAALGAGLDSFVYTSTQDVFTAGSGEDFDESMLDPLPKVTGYQRSKQEADQQVTAALERGLPAVILHPCAVYGPGPAKSPGMNDFFRDLLLGKMPLLLSGGMSLVYAQDVAEGHVLAEEKAQPGSRYILAERYYTLLELAQAVHDETGTSKIPAVMPTPLAKVISSLGERLAQLTKRPPLIPRGQLHGLLWGAKPRSERARADLGWQPRSLKEGLASTLAQL